jgi:hypothetical protein
VREEPTTMGEFTVTDRSENLEEFVRHEYFFPRPNVAVF